MHLDLIGPTEVAPIIGCSVAWVSTGLPYVLPPFATTRRGGGGPVWLREDVKAFARSRPDDVPITSHTIARVEYQLTWVLSTAHLTPEHGADLGGEEAIIADRLTFGWRMWVPEDIDDTSAAVEGDAPEYLIKIQRAARARGCDWVIFDADGPTWPDFKEYRW